MHRLLLNHLKHFTGSRSSHQHVLTLRCCSISWNICTHSSRCLVTLVCFVTSSVPITEGTYPPAVGYAPFFIGSLGPNPGCFVMVSRVPIPGCFYFLHGHVARVSSTTSNDFDANFSFRITAIDSSMNQLSSDVTGFKNTQASRDNRSRHFPRTTGMSTTLPMYKICCTSTMLMTSNVDSSISRELHRS